MVDKAGLNQIRDWRYQRDAVANIGQADHLVCAATDADSVQRGAERRSGGIGRGDKSIGPAVAALKVSDYARRQIRPRMPATVPIVDLPCDARGNAVRERRTAARARGAIRSRASGRAGVREVLGVGSREHDASRAESFEIGLPRGQNACAYRVEIGHARRSTRVLQVKDVVEHLRVNRARDADANDTWSIG